MLRAEIVLTGGPCAGKTTALDFIRQEFTTQGYRVLTAPEVATMYILGGFPDINVLSQNDRPTYLALERAMLLTQRTLKGVMTYLADELDEDVLVVYDRAELDLLAYIKPKEFFELIDEIRLDEEDLLEQYDLVIHLVTAADGAEEAYTLENNLARREAKIEDAREVDRKTMEAWIGHPNLVVISNEGDFAYKMSRVISEIKNTLNQLRSGI
jgi:thymidylate kinase